MKNNYKEIRNSVTLRIEKKENLRIVFDVNDIMKLLDVKQTKAYEVIKKINKASGIKEKLKGRVFIKDFENYFGLDIQFSYI